MFVNLYLTPLFLLQGDGIKYFKDDDPGAGWGILAIAGGVILLALVISIVKRILAGMGITSLSRSGGKRFGFFSVRRAAYHYRLSGDQMRMLEMVFRSTGVSDPWRALENTQILDRHFKQAYRNLTRSEKNDAEIQQQLSRLFSTRIVIESSPFGVSANGIPKITARSAAVLRMGGRSYNVTVLGTNGRQVTIDCPVNALGTPIPVSKGVKVALSFFMNATQGIASNAEVLRLIRDAKGTPVLELELKGKPETLMKRKSRRRQISIPCEIQFVTVTKSGNKNVMTADPRKHPGDIQDLSTGGCSIRSRGIFKPGGKIKIAFSSREGTVAAVGQILRINRGSSTNSIIHVKFIKIPLKSMNLINATVFEYNEL